MAPDLGEGSRRVPGGFFLSFEGVDCAGKSTQIKLLAEYLRRQGYAVCETREPGGTALGERLRQVVKHGSGDEAVCDEAELLLFCACRVQLMRQVILPCLDAGGIVLCDRFADSTTAYQGYGRGGDLATLDQLHRLATLGRWPNLTFLLDLTVEEMEQRARQRQDGPPAPDRFEDASRQFRERVRQGYLTLARLHPERIRVVPASAPIADLQRQLQEQLDHALARLR
jgi:dTMP kinase